MQRDEAVERLERALAGRYELQRELGGGGMASVFLARDLKHGRSVAIKLLGSAFTQAVGQARFLREIAITATLQHPHILPLHDSGEIGGQMFYVMPFVEGGTLRARMQRDRQMPIEDIVAIVRALAGALDYAHARNVVHRDLKPENILLSAGQPTLADFGIAVADASRERLTATGVAVGTPHYMSPEQIEGIVGPACDVYALGVVAYEMISGETPFTGSGARVLSRALSEEPPPIRRTDIPVDVDAAVRKALMKAPEDRYKTAGDFAGALALAAGIQSGSTRQAPRRQRTVVGAAVAGIVVILSAWFALFRTSAPVDGPLDDHVIAVLPMRVTASDSSYNYLREGALDLLGAQLTGAGMPRSVDTRVVLRAWRKAVAASGSELSLQQSIALARSLGAGRTLIGEFVANRAGVTMNAQLIRTRDATVLGRHTESATTDEIGLVNRVLTRLLATALGESVERLSGLSDSLMAIKAYLRGLELYRAGKSAGAIDQFGRALEIDRTFAAAALWQSLATSRGGGARKFLADSMVWAMKDRLSQRDQAMIASVWSFGPNYPGVSTMADFLRAFRRAAEVNPDRSEPWMDLGTALAEYGAAAGVEGFRLRAAAALDSAIALDSGMVPALQARFNVALAMNDSTIIRRLSPLVFPQDSVPVEIEGLRYLGASVLADSTALRSLRDLRRPLLKVNTGYEILDGSVTMRRSLDGAEAIVRSRAPDSASWKRPLLFDYAVVRGAFGSATELVGALPNGVGNAVYQSVPTLVPLAIVAPMYETYAVASLQALPAIQARIFPARRFETVNLCFAELWRVSRGDTVHWSARAAIMKRQIDSIRTRGLVARVGPMPVCPLLVAAFVEQGGAGASDTLALHRLDSLMALGTGRDITGPLANFMIAQWRAARGEYQPALSALRRRVYAAFRPSYLLAPDFLREEGRVASLAGDTARAIEAYRAVLTLRDRPEPGPMQDQVNRARVALTALTRTR